MEKRPKRKLKNAYDAWWFLYYHPKLMLRARNPEMKDNAQILKRKGFVITKDKSGQYWREHRHFMHHAIEENLSIHYAKVGPDGRVNDDPSLNVNPECWLEFGPMEWDYPSQWHKETSRMNFHDIELDCGGKTFDEALVKLAKLVLKQYGDYREKGKYPHEGSCGKPKCADCASSKRFARDFKRKMEERHHDSR